MNGWCMQTRQQNAKESDVLSSKGGCHPLGCNTVHHRKSQSHSPTVTSCSSRWKRNAIRHSPTATYCILSSSTMYAANDSSELSTLGRKCMRGYTVIGGACVVCDAYVYPITDYVQNDDEKYKNKYKG